MSTRFQIVLHAALFTALRAQPTPTQARFRRLAARLSAGDWGGGTRVKKLKGCGKPVFEARHDAGERVLFTLAHSATPDGDGALSPYLQVWDLVSHDDVMSAAARINPSAEAEFLGWPEIESELVTEPPPHLSAAFDDVPAAEDGTAAGVLELMLAPEDMRFDVREGMATGVRWYVVPPRLLARDDEWQELMDRGAEELELKLTADQYAIVRAPGPVLLTGSAGSGKTTIAVHRLAAATTSQDAGRALYITYSRWLLEHAQRLYADLLACRGESPVAPPRFLTVEQLYASLVAARGKKVPQTLADYGQFARWYVALFKRDDAVLAWEEIRSIVKGGCLDPGRPLLRVGEYETKGRKRAPLFVSERKRLHEVGRKWQEHLTARGMLDEIDLCRLALQLLRPSDSYDHVICDEAQDLAEIQVELLLRLHAGAAFGGLFLAGDPQQVVNPSGFRWAEVRSALRERTRGGRAPTLWSLSRNFRSVRGLVELANEVLAFKRERTGRSEGDENEESLVIGAVPVLVTGDEAALVAAVRGFGPRCAVVTGSPDSRDRLQELLDTTRIFTVPEAKGLEFDVVVLWGVVAADPEPWRRLLDPALTLREDPACRRALHHLYVAVTRARRHLAIHEPPEAVPLWTSPRFAARLDAAPPETLVRVFVPSAAPEAWRTEGHWFRARGRYRQAAECFRRAGDERDESECLAHHHEASGEHAEAARRWKELGDLTRAAACLERADEWNAAAALWQEAGDEAAARRCRIRASELARDWKRAAEEWEALHAWDDAARCWASCGKRPRQLECLARSSEASGDDAAAAKRWEETRAWIQAAAAWRRAGLENDALRAEASADEASRRFARAAATWAQLGDEARAVRCRAQAAEHDGQWAAAAGHWESHGDLDAALRCWKRSGDARAAAGCEARIDLVAQRYARAAEALEQLRDFAGAAVAWESAHGAGQQPRASAKLPVPPAAREVWVKGAKRARLSPLAKPFDALTRSRACAIRAAEDARRFEEAARVWAALRDRSQVQRCLVAAFELSGNLVGAAELLEKEKLLEPASSAWLRAGRPLDALRCQARHAEKRRRFDEASSLYASAGLPLDAVRCRAHGHEARGQHAEAAEAWEAAGDSEQARTSRIVGRWRSGDFDGAIQLAVESGNRTLVRSLQAQRPRPQAASPPRRSVTRVMHGAPVVRSTPVVHATPVVRRTSDMQGELFDEAQVARPAPSAAELASRVLRMLTKQDGVTCEDLGSLLGVRTTELSPVLRQLAAAGHIRKTGRARGTRYWP